MNVEGNVSHEVALQEFLGTYFDQLKPPAVSLLDLKGALLFFHTVKGSLVNDDMSTKKIV